MVETMPRIIPEGIVEIRSRIASPEITRKEPFAVVIPGASSSTLGMSALQTGFEKDYGEGNAHVYNSILFSGEPTSPDRYTKMALEIKGKLSNGRNVDIYLLSLGAPESCQTVEALAYQLDEPLETYKEQLHFYYISPAAPKTRKEAAQYVGKYAKVAFQEAAILPRPFPGRSRLLRGIMSFSTIPPENFNDHAKIYTKGIRNATRELSHMGESVQEIPFTSDPERNYLSVIKPEKREKMRAIDEELLAATQQGGEDKKVRRLLQRRARLVWSDMGKIYGGKYAEKMGDTPGIAQNIKSSLEGRQLKRKVLADAFWRTEIHEKLSEMAESGMHMTIIIPEYDILFTLEEANELASKGPNVDVFMAALTTHAFPWGSRPEITRNVARPPHEQ